MDITADFVLGSYVVEAGYGTIADALTAIEHRHQLRAGSLADRYCQRLRQRPDGDQGCGHQSGFELADEQGAQDQGSAAAVEALTLMPAAEFFTAIEAAHHNRLSNSSGISRRPPSSGGPTLLERADAVFKVHEQPWGVIGNSIRWVGHPLTQQVAIGPALEALDDVRFAAARGPFEAAPRVMRQGHPKALESSVLESGQAVEAALEALLLAHDRPLPRLCDAESLWTGVVSEGLMDGMWHETILAASSVVRTADKPPFTQFDAELAFAGAALAIKFISLAMPPLDRSRHSRS